MTAGDPVEELWERFRPLVRERLDLLARHAAGDPHVDRADAARAAHNLAGSLGSYGRAEGSRLARRIDEALSTGLDGEVDLAALVAQLRAAVDV